CELIETTIRRHDIVTHMALDIASAVFFFSLRPPHPTSPLFPYTTLFRSSKPLSDTSHVSGTISMSVSMCPLPVGTWRERRVQNRSEEHTSELQSPCNLVCRLLLEKKKPTNATSNSTCSTSRRSSTKQSMS